MIKKLLALTFFYFCCSCDCYDCYHNYYQNITNYEVNPNTITPGGIQVDTSDFEVDLEEIDRQVDYLENCMQENFSSPDFEVSGEVLDQQECWNEDLSPDIIVRRDCLIVKIAPDWFVSPCSGQQVFECNIRDSVCEDKGLEITDECPCMCRSTIQDENVIITTPDLYLFRGELGRMVTSCNNPWFEPVNECLLDR